MLAEILPKILVVGRDPALLTGLQPVLTVTGARIEVADCATTALTAMVAAPLPMLALLDGALPEAEIGLLIATAHASGGDRTYPIVLLSDIVPEEWNRRLAEGFSMTSFLALQRILIGVFASISCFVHTIACVNSIICARRPRPMRKLTR